MTWGLLAGRSVSTRVLGAVCALALPCAAAAVGGSGRSPEPWPTEVVTGRYGPLPGEYETASLPDGTILGISSFCVDDRGGVVVLDATGRRLTAYDARGERLRDILLPDSTEGLRVASAGGRLYALCAWGAGRAASARERERPVRGGVGACAAGAASVRGDLRLVAYLDSSGRWVECAAVTAFRRGGTGCWYEKVFLVERGLEIYMCDPAARASAKLTEAGGPVQGRRAAAPERGLRLPSGARAVKCGWGISLLWDDGSRRDMPWLAGSLIGGDLAGRLYFCEIDDRGGRAEVSVAAYEGDALVRARWRLPGRPGEVRMLGPRIIVSENGGLYEFWSTCSEFHIAHWAIEGELAEGRPD